MDAPSPASEASPRARRRAALVAGAALAVLVAWLAIDAGEVEPVAAASEALPEVVRVAAEPAPAVVAVEAPAADRGSEAGEVQICGGDWVKVGADGQADPADAEAASQRLTEAAESVALPAMEASPDERVRAAAHYFRSGRERLLGAVQPECKDDDACRRRVDAWREGWQAERDALVQLAQHTNDADVYAWAWRSCQGAARGASGACQLANAAQWARLDPTNAAPWLAVAAEAKERQDEAALDDAMFHVASAARYDSAQGAVPRLIIAHLPPGDTHAVGAIGLATQAFGVESQIEIADVQTALQYCQSKDLGDANRRETCSAMANVLAYRSTTLLASTVGKGLGKRVDWPGERIKALDDERDALVKFIAKESASGNDLQDCRAVHRTLERFSETGRVGELETLRRAVTASATSTRYSAAPPPGR